MKKSIFKSILCITLALLCLFQGQCIALSRPVSDEDIITWVEPFPLVMPLSSTAEPDWYYTEPEFAALPLFNLTGKGVRIGIVDSGIAVHQDIPQSQIVAQQSFIEGDETVTDSYGHGTAVTGLIIGQGEPGSGAAGIAPDAEIVNAKCIKSDGKLSMSDVVDAVAYCIEQDCDIINLSLGTAAELDYTKYQVMLDLEALIDFATENGIIVIAAVGNSGSASTTEDFIVYPAGYENVIGVSAIATGNTHYSSANKNASVFISAPGQSMQLASNSSQTGYRTASGTSFAAPVVSGLTALIKQAAPSATLSDVKTLLQNTAVDLGTSGYDYTFGHGTVNGRNIAKAIRNSDFYAYTDDSGTAYAANIGGARQISSYRAEYTGAKNAAVSQIVYTYADLERKEIPAGTTGKTKQFFWNTDTLQPLCGHLEWSVQ